MGKHFRIFIAFIVILGIALLARNRAAWASNPGSGADQTSPEQAALSAFLAPKDCPKGLDNDFGKRAIDKCNDRDSQNDLEDDNGQADDEDDDDGTVKPPPFNLIIPLTGDYSLGGFCTLSVELRDSNIRLDATLETPLPGELPDSVQQIRQGCLLTYYSADERIDQLPETSGNTTICFAALPNQQMVLYFYNIYDLDPVWAPLETTVEQGIACGAGPKSGVYLATFQK